MHNIIKKSVSYRWPVRYRGTVRKSIVKRLASKLLLVMLFISVLLIGLILSQFTYSNTLPDYLQGGGDATRTLGNFINGVLRFITALLWGVWTIFSGLFAKDLMIGADADLLKSKAIKLGASALILVTITTLPALFAGFAN